MTPAAGHGTVLLQIRTATPITGRPAARSFDHMTDVASRSEDLFKLPVADALAGMRAQGLLPSSTTETRWSPAGAPVRTRATTALAQCSPRYPFTEGRATVLVMGPQWYTPGFGVGLGEVSMRNAGSLGSIAWFTFENLGANATCIAWFDMQVLGPASTSFTLTGTGNPSTLVVTNQASSGQRVSVPLFLTATPDGRAYCTMYPTKLGHTGMWFGTRVDKL
jgi:hypothetical protein